jgi:AcrR family transcriptional regulator
MDEKKLEILERASAVYMKYGIKTVTMDDLARELGISKKTIYKYFDDKNDLVRSIIEMKVSMDAAICVNCMQNSENAIDDLFNLSKLVVEHFSNINPAVFYDLRKYHPDAWGVMEKHKWEFVQSMIQENVERGIKENIYRKSLHPEIMSRLYVSSTDAILNSNIFPWPEFKFQEVFIEMIHFQLYGMVNDEGRKYLKQKLQNETNV